MFKNKIITGLDIGTSSIKTLVVRETGKKDLEVLVQSEGPSSGLRRGIVFNIEEAAKSISSAVSEAEEVSDRKIKSAFVNINGGHLYVTSSHGLVSVSRADEKISEEDVERVIRATKTVNLPPNDEVFDVFPIEFTVDEQKGIKQPVGLSGIRLEARVFLLCAFSSRLKKLTQSVLEANLQIDDVIPSPLAAAKAVLTKQEKELGVALIDIGAATVGLAVFEEGQLIHFAVFPLGSSYITNDIAIGLRTEISTAEKIKKEYGACLLDKKKKSKAKKIDFTNERETVGFSSKTLVGIIEPRVSEIFDLIQKELKKIGKQELLPGGIILTGGGAKIPKIVELAKNQFKLPCKIGIPKGIIGLEKDTSLAVVAGLALEGAGEEKKGGFTPKLKKIFKIFKP